MIQTLGDLLTLIAIIAMGLLSFLLAVLLYHLIFVVMDLRRITRRVDVITEQVEEVVSVPVGISQQFFEWLQEALVDYFGEKMKKKEPPKKKKKGGQKVFVEADVA